MGLENTGFALANQDLLWIDPLDYQADLACRVDMLRAAGMNVSIYNLPLCLLDRSVWDFAVQSISDWKKGYLPECDGCAARRRCAGFFSSGRPRLSRGISPITSDRPIGRPDERLLFAAVLDEVTADRSIATSRICCLTWQAPIRHRGTCLRICSA
jgi:hypothetical protein